MADPIHRQLVNCYQSDVRADTIRPFITAALVSQDCDSLVQLIKGRWYHAALDLTGRLLTVCGFASDTGTRLTPFSSQLWLVWFVLLKQIQQFDLLERELAAFDRLDNPDIYFEHAPNLYPRRKGFNDPLLVATTSCGVAAPLESVRGGSSSPLFPCCCRGSNDQQPGKWLHRG
ncbi:Trafficking protein particle complex subunit 12 [Echinococcus granulosus]|nr:Trafficking protein particle complex subunit 12 [Echinococcus granulosus]